MEGDWATIFWLAAVAVSIRCLFEPVMVPYYVMPSVAISFAVGATRETFRWLLTLAAGFGLTLMTFSHSNMWTYWFEMAGLMAALLIFAQPTPTAGPRSRATERALRSTSGDGAGGDRERLWSRRRRASFGPWGQDDFVVPGDRPTDSIPRSAWSIGRKIATL